MGPLASWQDGEPRPPEDQVDASGITVSSGASAAASCTHVIGDELRPTMTLKTAQKVAPKKTRVRSPALTRAKLIQAAAGLFRAQGYAPISLRDIAKAAGVSTGSMYHHFSSKDEAVQEILNLAHQHVLERAREAVDDLPSTATVRDKLQAAVRAHVMALLGDNSLPAANMRIFSQVPREVRAGTLRVRHEYEQFWIDLLVEGQAEGFVPAQSNAQILAPLLFGAMNWMLEWYDPGRYGMDSVVNQIVDMVVRPSGHLPARFPSTTTKANKTELSTA